jgi:porin
MLSAAGSVHGSESSSSPEIAPKEGTDTVEATIERRDSLDYDPTRRTLFPDFYYKYRSWREKLFQKIGLQATLSYDILGQGISESSDQDYGTSGDLTFSARWLLLGEMYNKPVYLSFRTRYRHKYSAQPPSLLGPNNGLLWKTVDGFTDAELQIPDLYLSQELFDSRLTLRYGQYSIDSFVDNHNLRSAKRFFLNQMFSNNPSVPFPSYGAGFALQWQDTRNWDFTFGGSNIQSTDSLNRDEVNFNLGSSALFYATQGGYNFTGLNKRDARAQLMVWNSQENSEHEIPSTRGISLTLEHSGKLQTEHYVGRLAFSEGESVDVDRLAMIGYGREIRGYDNVGVGIGAGRSAVKTSRWQCVTEIYYRWQVAKELVITPDLQMIFGSGVDGEDRIQFVAGIRTGLTF